MTLVVRDVDLDDLTDRGLLKATLAAVTRMESQMSQMNEALGRLSTAVTDQRDRMQGQIDALTSALENERQAATALAESEMAEDVAQDQALAEARQATDAAVNDLQGGIEQVNTLADEVLGINQGEQPAPGDEVPDEPEPVTDQPEPESEPLPEPPAEDQTPPQQ